VTTPTYSLACNTRLTEDYIHSDSILASGSAATPLATFVNSLGESEALLIQDDGELCHLQRELLSSSGWNIYGIGAVVESIAAASSGNVWITDQEEDIWQSNAGHWNLIDSTHVGLSGISVGRDGAVYAVGEASDQTSHMFTFDPATAMFQDNGTTPITGAPAGNAGSLWALANGNQVFMNGPSAWTQAPGAFNSGDLPSQVIGPGCSQWRHGRHAPSTAQYPRPGHGLIAQPTMDDKEGDAGLRPLGSDPACFESHFGCARCLVWAFVFEAELAIAVLLCWPLRLFCRVDSFV
jgi:hypothetical protein